MTAVFLNRHYSKVDRIMSQLANKLMVIWVCIFAIFAIVVIQKLLP